MIDRCTIPPLAARVSSLFLDYGADAQECTEDSVAISERGMQVRSRWQFDIGTQLSLSFVFGEACRGERATIEAMVVGCEPSLEEPGIYESTLLFFEIPEGLRRTLQGATRD